MNQAERIRDDEMKVREAVNKLAEYQRQKTPKFKRERYEIAEAILPLLQTVDIVSWCQLYDAAVLMLWQLHDHFREDQIAIRRRFIDPAIARFETVKSVDYDHKGNNAFMVLNATDGVYAPFKQIYAHLSGMAPSFLYVYGRHDPDVVREVEEMGHTVRLFGGAPHDLVRDRIRQACREDGIRVLIAETRLSIPTITFLGRAAPIQCHLACGFQLNPGSDYLLCSITQPPMDLPEINGIPCVPNPIHEKHLPFGLKKETDGLTFGCLARGEKMSTDYLDTVSLILDENPGSQFVTFGSGHALSRDYRMIHRPVTPRNEALAKIDVFLDTFPTCCDMSAWEALAAGIPVVSLRHPSMGAWNDLKPFVANTMDEYRKLAGQAIRGDLTFDPHEVLAPMSAIGAGEKLEQILAGLK